MLAVIFLLSLSLLSMYSEFWLDNMFLLRLSGLSVGLV
jgi:hypothetical protein